jgi:hypothetical protein
VKLLKFCVRCSRHDARQILRIGEKREDAMDWEGNPVFELELCGHAPRRLPLHKSHEFCHRWDRISTGESLLGAECKINLSE